MNEIQVEILRAELLQGLVERRLNIFGSMECVPKLYICGQSGIVILWEIARRTFEVSQTWSRGTPLSFSAWPTSSSFYASVNASFHVIQAVLLTL